jgi:hypothetical protein
MLKVTLGAALLLALPGVARATTYEVGPGQTYASLGDVPWPTIAAGDTVRIHARSTPYREKFIVNATGTPGAPILIQGVPDASGALPILDGDNAVEPASIHGYQDDSRFLIKVGDASAPSNPNGGSYITIEGLHLRNANPSYTFTSQRLGAGAVYDKNAAGIWLQHGDHLTVRGCELELNGNGIFAAYGAGNPVSDVLIEGNFLHDNGIPSDAYEHNSYVQVQHVVYQFNHYGPPLPSSQGNNLKDRSSGMVARFNWIEGGERALDLVDNGEAAVQADPGYATAYVYGNVILKTQPAGNNAVLHFGGDSGNTAAYRTTLWLFNNTIVSSRTGNCTLLQINAGQTVHVLNNVITASAGATVPSTASSAGTVLLDHNWTPGAAGNDPGFVDLAGQDFHLTTASALIDAAAPLPTDLAAFPLDRQYLKHQGSEARPADAALDIGAFELGGTPTTSGSTSGSASSSASTASSSTASSSGSTAGASASSSSGTTTAGSGSGSGSTAGSGTGSTGRSVSTAGSTGAVRPGLAKGGCGCSDVGGETLFGLLALLAAARRRAR